MQMMSVSVASIRKNKSQPPELWAYKHTSQAIPMAGGQAPFKSLQDTVQLTSESSMISHPVTMTHSMRGAGCPDPLPHHRACGGVGWVGFTVCMSLDQNSLSLFPSSLPVICWVAHKYVFLSLLVLASRLLEFPVEGAEVWQVVLASLQACIRLDLMLPHVVVVHILNRHSGRDATYCIHRHQNLSQYQEPVCRYQ